MQKYKYQAIDINKKKFTGSFLAENEESLKAQLAAQGLFLVSAKPVSDKSPQASFFSTSTKVKLTEITNFCRQFSILINSGISIVESLEILKNQPYSQLFKSILDVVHEDVKAGLLLSEALDKHEKVFPEFFRSMTYVGEMSGSLDSVLSDLANYYELDDKIKRQIKGAMTSPIVLLLLVVGIIVLMFCFVVPTFKEALANLNVEMPAITLMIFNMSQFFLDYWYIMLAVVVLLVLLIKVYIGTESGRYNFDTFKLKAPIIKPITINTVASRFTHGFSLLITSGMDLVDAMKVMVKVFGNKNIEEKFAKATDDVQRGASLTVALNTYQIFPDMLIQMVAVGEKTGQLDEVLQRSCNYYDEQLSIALNSITTVIQPILLVVAGSVIGIMFMAIYSPILQIIQTIG